MIRQLNFFRFPKDDACRALWLKICNLSNVCDVSETKICSAHFKEQDYSIPNAHSYGGVLKLKRGVVPSINVPNPCKTLKVHPVYIRTASFHFDFRICTPQKFSDTFNLCKRPLYFKFSTIF